MGTVQVNVQAPVYYASAGIIGPLTTTDGLAMPAGWIGVGTVPGGGGGSGVNVRAGVGRYRAPYADANGGLVFRNATDGGDIAGVAVNGAWGANTLVIGGPWPTRPTRMILDVAAGGGYDIAVNSGSVLTFDATTATIAPTLRTYGVRRQKVLVTAATSPYTVLANDHEILCDASGGGALILLLPAIAAANDGREIVVKVFAWAAGGTVTITPNGAQTTEGAASIVLNAAKQCRVIGAHFAGTDWYLKSAYL